MNHKSILVTLGVILGVGATLLAQQAMPIKATQRFPYFENEHVKVWKTVIVPGSPLGMHRHEHGRTLIALTTDDLTIRQDTGEESVLKLEAGKAYWLDADPPGNKLHADLAKGTRNIEVVVVEMKKDR